MDTPARLRGEVADRYAALALRSWPDPHADRAPSESESERESDPQRYRIVAARARLWVEVLVHRALRVDPPAGVDGAAPLWLVESLTPAGPETLPVLHLSAGRVEDLRARFPFCGCDACDHGSDRLLDELDDAITRVIADTESTAHRPAFGER
ncbi:DUF6226 family protein [Micrococcus luteus]|uniref:DUF6226 family protein n=1 Tax=Micrococcus luteus TaxID=1270 RepID=UPI0011AB6745|nr:DUF6226 family protein [Micrococcus luteus]